MMQNLYNKNNSCIRFHLGRKKNFNADEYEIWSYVENGQTCAGHHIDFRDYYVEGCGQLCRDCYNSVYHT
jgi:hypothetical protein